MVALALCLEVISLLDQCKHTGRRLESSLILSLLCISETQNACRQVDFNVFERAHGVDDLLLFAEALSQLADTSVLAGEREDGVVSSELAVQDVAYDLLSIGRQSVTGRLVVVSVQEG